LEVRRNLFNYKSASKRRLGTFKVFFGLILLILFSFLMALFFYWKKDVIGNSTNPDPEWKRGRY